MIAKHIGFNIVAVGKPANVGSPNIEIMQSDSTDEGAYIPAKSIQVYGAEGITNLRDFCNEILNKNEKAT